ncbi:MAG: hypothetical protein HY909_08665 [Deltaproteobacteria bacterium]|nr:hypothetical protein [Deltaproteobacteria bacterium]
MSTETTQAQRKNLYRGSMGPQEARDKLTRLSQRLGLTELKIKESRAEGGPVQLSFKYQGARLERACSTQPTTGANLVCLALWLEDRARNLERGIETFTEAFADALVLVHGEGGAAGGAAPEFAGERVNYYEGSRSVEDCIALFRAVFPRLKIPEADVKVTWDTEANWARLRMRLPSGAIVEKVSRVQKNFTANLAVLALWLQARARNWERGIESLDLDRVFAGNLLPARAS